MSGIELTTSGPVLTVTINRPGALNALNTEAHHALAEAFDRFATDDDLHIAVITGAGDRAFCAGSDLKERARNNADDLPSSGFAGLTTRFDLTKPVIAAVNGDAIGGGMEIVLACDLALAAAHARFGLPEPKVGLAAIGGLHRLARQLPLKQAMDVALTGRLFGADEALRLGLINAVVPGDNLAAEVARWCDMLGEGSILSLKASKQMMLDGLDCPSLKAAFAADYPAVEAMLASNDAIEGQRAFVEKRMPRWRGN